MDVIYLILKLNESKKNQKMQFVIALNVFKCCFIFVLGYVLFCKVCNKFYCC